MRLIQLTHEEIEVIKIALQVAYTQNVELVVKNRIVIGEDATKALNERAQTFLEVSSVFDGERDK